MVGATFLGAVRADDRSVGLVCLLAGLVGMAAAVFLIVVDPAVGEDRYSYPLTPGGFAAIDSTSASWNYAWGLSSMRRGNR